MSRLDFEADLIRDEGLRVRLAGLARLGKRVNDLQADLQEARAEMHHHIYDLRMTHGVPAAFLARQVGLSPQRMASILNEQAAKV